jgi:hypothetical protein
VAKEILSVFETNPRGAESMTERVTKIVHANLR